MLKSQIFSRVVIFFIFINTDLSEAKGGRGGGGRGGRSRGRSRGGGDFGGWSGGGFYDLEIFFYVLAFVVFLFCVFYCVYGCDDDENEKENDSNQNSNKRSIAKRSMVQNQQYLRNQNNETAINMQPAISPPRKQFPVNQNCDTYSGKKVPHYLPYPIAPVTFPAPIPGNQNGTSNSGSGIENPLYHD